MDSPPVEISPVSRLPSRFWIEFDFPHARRMTQYRTLLRMMAHLTLETNSSPRTTSSLRLKRTTRLRNMLQRAQSSFGTGRSAAATSL